MLIQNLKKELQIVSKENKSGGGQRGVSIYLALMVMIVLLAIGLGINTIIISQMKMITGMEDSVVALYAADSGVEEVLYNDKICRLQSGCAGWGCIDETDCDEGISGGSTPVTSIGNIQGADVKYQATFDPGALDIISVGMYKQTRRAIEVTRTE
jgi:hypothetical protein